MVPALRCFVIFLITTNTLNLCLAEKNLKKIGPKDTATALLNPIIGINGVRRLNIIAGAVDGSRIADSAISSSKIAPNSITSSHLSSALQTNLEASAANQPNSIIRRDRYGNFNAGTIKADLIGNVTGNITNPSVVGNMNIQGDQLTQGNFTSNGDATIGGENGLVVSNTANVGGEFLVSGGTYLSSTLDIDGSTQINNQLTLYGGDLTIASNRAGGGNVLIDGFIASPATADNSVSSSARMIFIDADGVLGTIVSSKEYKENIKNLEACGSQLEKLRPVSFTYKNDTQKHEQLGLIAEEVATTNPQLAIYNQAGKPETVAYHLLIPLLLGAYQEQSKQLGSLQQTVAAQEIAISKLLAAIQTQP
jgi:hypothetical protein